MELWYNPEDEDHRNWLENFGKKKSDNVNDNRADNFFGLKKIPVVEVTVPDCSFQDTYPEWINPVTGEETGEQIVDINCEAHLGLYYFVFANMFWLLNACNGIKKIVKANRRNP